ncbi:sugar transferase [Candidatus Omnitrophota bacterium]
MVTLSVVAIVCLAGLFFKNATASAVTYVKHPQISNPENIKIDSVTEHTDSKPEPVRKKSRVPEASTVVLFLGGITGMIARFIRKSFEKFKRIFDLSFSILGLTLASPILFLAAILIKSTSKGPVVYKQNRMGKNGEIFEIYKLRTMRVDAEKGCGAVWALKNDPRVTRVGRFLRNTHIDEIPQFINVFKGEMSIVGPRPERPEMVRDLKKVIRDYEKRHLIKPGITGLAQVLHKYDETIEDVKKKIKYDLSYIRKRCLSVDLKILAQTIIAILIGKSAR